MKQVTVAICTYNRAAMLPKLIEAVRAQQCALPFEILVVDNNSPDETQSVLAELAAAEGPALRVVREERQGIVPARNLAIAEAGDSAYLVFIDDDELPVHGWLEAAVDALEREGADCVGGEIRVGLRAEENPAWLEEELLGFLGKVEHAAQPFWVDSLETPVWSGNIAYRTALFASGLRFDQRYNRQGNAVGGGEDAIMFRALLQRGARIRYRPDMAVVHHVDKRKLRRRYFLRLHFEAGRKSAFFGAEEYKRTYCGIPPFLIAQTLQQFGRTLGVYCRGGKGGVRQAMNAFYLLGMLGGRYRRWCREDG